MTVSAHDDWPCSFNVAPVTVSLPLCRVTGWRTTKSFPRASSDVRSLNSPRMLFQTSGAMSKAYVVTTSSSNRSGHGGPPGVSGEGPVVGVGSRLPDDPAAPAEPPVPGNPGAPPAVPGCGADGCHRWRPACRRCR